MVGDVFYVGGFLHPDALGYAVQIVLNQDALLTRSVITSLRELLAPMHIVIHLANTQVHNAVVELFLRRREQFELWIPLIVQ